MMTTRTDIHRPSQIDPTEYEYVAPERIDVRGLEGVEALKYYREVIRAHMANTGGTYSTHEHGGNCMVCGNAFAIWTVLFYHRPTNTYVRMGTECARQVEDAFDSDVRKLQRAVKEVEARKAGKQKAEQVLREAGLIQAWEIYENGDAFGPYEESTIYDIVSKLVRWGDLSEKQLAFLSTLLERIEKRPEVEAQREAEREAAEDAPTGRVEVTGEIVSLKYQDNPYQRNVPKIIVKTEKGWKLYTTCPAAAFDNSEQALRGQTITLKVTVTPAADDPKFAFGKRPTFVALATSEE